jgi:hypothetical protein
MKYMMLVIFGSAMFSGCQENVMQRKGVIEHKNPHNSPRITAVEYFLPATEMPQDVRDGLHPWIRQMVGKQPDEVKELLVERWKGIKNPALRKLRDRLLDFQPDSIVVHRGEGFLSMHLTPGVTAPCGDSWYLPAPGDNAEWERRIKQLGINNPAFLEFVQSFAGLREDIPDMSGDFLYVDPWETFPLEGYELKDIKNADKWQGSLIVYDGRGGYHALLHPSGRVGWWLMPEGEVIDSKQDFESFANYFTDYSRQYSYPFDPFPMDENRRKN